MNHIAIIGVGGFGSRHLQSLAKLKDPAVLYIVDASETSIDIAIQRFESMSPGGHLKLTVCSSLEELPEHLDLALVATGSLPRRHIFECLLQARTVRMIITEKVLFPSLDDYDAVGSLIREKNVRVWVNNPRRILPFYDDLVRRLQDETSLRITVTGGNWGLGCNSIHYLDLFCRLAGETNSLTIDTSGLDAEIIQGKRDGYIEFTGTISGSVGRCTDFSLISTSGISSPIIMVILGESTGCIINQGQNKAFWMSGKNNWELEEVPMNRKNQSELTCPIVEQLLSEGSCSLTDFETSAREHIPLIRAFLEFLSKRENREVTVCPIT